MKDIMKKNLLSVIILALLVVNIVLTSVMMFSVMSTNNKTAELVTNIATVMNLELTVPGEEELEVQISWADTAVYNLSSSLTLPLAYEKNADGTEGKQSYIMFDVALSMNTKHEDYEDYSETIADRESLIKDAIRAVVNTYTESDCRADLETGMEGLKTDILKAIQDLFQSDFIYNVAISEVKFG